MGPGGRTAPSPPARGAAAGTEARPGRHGGPSWPGRHARGDWAGCRPAPCAGTALAGRYRLTGRVGGPDWASVWQGTDELLARPVTLRVFRQGPLPARVAAAVRGAGRLTDPRLARIYDADDDGERPYVVSEWAPGRRLDRLLAARLPSPGLAVRIAAEVAAALAGAHQAGQAHQCLGPGSVRWDGAGVKITGLAVEAAIRGLPPGATPAAVTADTRALGELLYALLTGHWPGSEPGTLPAAPRHSGRLCPPAELSPGIPAGISAAVCAALLPGPAAPGAPPPARTPAQFVHALRHAIHRGGLPTAGRQPAARAA